MLLAMYTYALMQCWVHGTKPSCLWSIGHSQWWLSGQASEAKLTPNGCHVMTSVADLTVVAQ